MTRIPRPKTQERESEGDGQSRMSCTVRAATPNNSFNRTRYGRHRKAGLRHMVHHLSPAIRCLPPRAG
jgi:hypothetical protein